MSSFSQTPRNAAMICYTCLLAIHAKWYPSQLPSRNPSLEQKQMKIPDTDSQINKLTKEKLCIRSSTTQSSTPLP
ncbi:hypothetical protein DL95DRAFT_391772, partial [Leptodontidium sp. 2 PMI_412]